MNELIKIFKFNALDLPQFTEVRGKDWVNFGKDNLFPDKLIELSQSSAIHNTAIRSKLDATIGEGISNFGDTIVNQKGESLNDIYKKLALDYITFGGYSINPIFNRAGDKIVEIYHIDFSKVRSGKLNEDDEVTEYFYSSNWVNTRKFKPIRYSAFNTKNTRGENASQIFYYYDYQPGSDVYPVPSYIGSLNDINLDGRVSKFHNANISNGMSPGLFINLPNGEPSDEEKRMLYRDLTDTFSGEENAGRMFLTFSEGSDLSPQITTIPSANDTYYITLEERISSRILTAHRITSPLLIGIRDGGGLGNNSEELEVAYTHFMSSVIEPIQKNINKSLNNVLNRFGINEPITIIPSTLDFNKNIQQENIL